jgi:uncharacterized membrane protein YidH (DUF202 family)
MVVLVGWEVERQQQRTVAPIPLLVQQALVVVVVVLLEQMLFVA